MINPFTFGNPIKDPARFIGRQAEIRQIVNRLLSSAHESTSVIGERRVGKTSLLTYLSNPEVAVPLGLSPERFCLVYVDFQGLTDITPHRFWQRILKKMAGSVCDEELKPAILSLYEQSDFDLFDLEDIFQALQAKGLTTVLLLDEFEYVTQNPNFKGDFFGGLRAMAIHHGVALVPATRRELVDLCHSEEIKGSPFFNIFANVILRPFNRSEVFQLLEKYSSSGTHSLTIGEQEFSWKLAGGNPLFVQIAGYYLVEGREQGLTGERLEVFITQNFFQQADSHYLYLWSHCSESEKITLLVLLALESRRATRKNRPTSENISRIRPRAMNDLVSLAKRGLIEEREDLYFFSSTSLEAWLRREITAVPGEEEKITTAEEWLRSGGLDHLQPVKGTLPRFKKKYWHLLADVAKDLSLELAVTGAVELIKILV